MKKLLILTALVLGCLASSNAQGLNFGFKGGVNFSDLNTTLDTDARTGFHIGAVLELKINDNFSIQPEALYSTQGADVSTVDTNIDYLNVPVLVKYNFLKILSVEVGPQFGFAVQEGKSSLATGEFKNFDVSGAAGVGVKITKFFAQARYNFGLTDAYENVESKNATFQISVGYYIF